MIAFFIFNLFCEKVTKYYRTDLNSEQLSLILNLPVKFCDIGVVINVSNYYIMLSADLV